MILCPFVGGDWGYMQLYVDETVGGVRHSCWLEFRNGHFVWDVGTDCMAYSVLLCSFTGIYTD